jgi:outer membrane protein TolC
VTQKQDRITKIYLIEEKSMVKKFLLMTFLISMSYGQNLMTAEDAIMIGLKNNFDIQIARNQEAIAKNNAGKSLSGFLPTLGVAGSYQDQKSKQETNSPFSFGNSESTTLSGDIALNWILFDGFSMFVNHDQYQQLEKLGEYQARNIIETTVVTILSAYFNLVQQEQLLDVARETLEISNTRLERERVRQELGSASSTDFWNAQVSYNNDQAQLVNQELRRLIAQKDLNTLLARDVDTPVQVVKQIIIPDLAYSYEEILSFAKKQNSRLLVAQQDKTVAENNVALRRAYFYPQLSLIARYAYADRGVDSDDPRFTSTIETQSQDGIVGLNLSFNLFNGMRDKIDLQNAKLEAKNKSLSLQDQENRLAATVREKLETFYKRLELIGLEEQNVLAAQQNLQLNRDRFEIGASSFLEFRDAQVNLTRSQSTLIVARYQARITRLELEQLMGTWEIPE